MKTVRFDLYASHRISISQQKIYHMFFSVISALYTFTPLHANFNVDIENKYVSYKTLFEIKLQSMSNYSEK